MEKEKDQSNINVGGGGSSQQPKECENSDKSLWWVGGFLLAMILLAILLAII